jgi:hypothetical protein
MQQNCTLDVSRGDRSLILMSNILHDCDCEQEC